MSDDDGAADRRQIQMFITAVAGYVADKTREREEQLQRAAAESAERSRVLQAQLAAEHASAQAVWQPTLQPDWWMQATVEDVQRAYQAAAEWAPFDENAAQAAETIAERVGMGVEPDPPADAIAETRNLSSEEAADAHTAEWDTRERRTETAATAARTYQSAGLEELAVLEAVEADRIADTAQARPASDAVKRDGERAMLSSASRTHHPLSRFRSVQRTR